MNLNAPVVLSYSLLINNTLDIYLKVQDLLKQDDPGYKHH